MVTLFLSLIITCIITNGAKLMILLSIGILSLLLKCKKQKTYILIGIFIIYFAFFITFRNKERSYVGEIYNFKVSMEVFSKNNIKPPNLDTKPDIDLNVKLYDIEPYLYNEMLIVNFKSKDNNAFRLLNSIFKEEVDNNEEKPFIDINGDENLKSKKSISSYNSLSVDDIESVFFLDKQKCIEGSFFFMASKNQNKLFIYINNKVQPYSPSKQNLYKKDFEQISNFLTVHHTNLKCNGNEVLRVNFIKNNELIRDKFKSECLDLCKKSPKLNTAVIEEKNLGNAFLVSGKKNPKGIFFNVFNNKTQQYTSFDVLYKYEIEEDVNI